MPRYRDIRVVQGQAGVERVLFLMGVPEGETGDGLFVLDSRRKQIREGVDFLAQFPEGTPDEVIVARIKELGFSEHLNPEYR